MSSILIVDDSPSVHETLISILEGQGYDLHSAMNGSEALEQAEKFHPDIVLLDVMMPGMDGFEVCSRLRSDPILAEIPIVILTALDDKESLLRGIEAGADDFLTKPVDRHELRARVRTITRLNRYRTLLEQRESLRMMAENILTAQEAERRRISHELHDDLGQALTSQMLDIRNLQNALPVSQDELNSRLQNLNQQSRALSIKVRQLAQNMRPQVLDAMGLIDAMRIYCTEISQRAQLPIVFEADEEIPSLPDAFNLTLYRILQEALNNVIKHAQASQAWVGLSFESPAVLLTVQDNGHGFDAQAVGSGGIGLKGLRERLAIAGGALTVRSKPALGTILTAELPLSSGQKPKERTWPGL